jgi:hypothetical protein
VANLFSSQTPTLTNVSEAVPVTVATTVYFTVSGTVTGGRFYAPTTIGAGTYSMALWQVTADDSPAGTGTGTLLASSNNFGAVTPGAWNSIAFTSSAPVTTGVAYRIGLRTSEGRYTATGAGFSTAGITNGNIVAPQTGTNPAAVGIGLLDNGSFGSGLVNYPASTFNGNQYFVDVEFADAGDITPPSVPTGLTATAIGVSTVDLSWNAATDNVGVTGYEIQIIGP